MKYLILKLSKQYDCSMPFIEVIGQAENNEIAHKTVKKLEEEWFWRRSEIYYCDPMHESTDFDYIEIPEFAENNLIKSFETLWDKTSGSYEDAKNKGQLLG